MDYDKQEHSPYSRFASASEIKENLYKVDFNGKAKYGGIPLYCENGEVYVDHTVFLIIPYEHTLYHRLISVFIKQCYSTLIMEAQKEPSKKLPIRVNFLLDEFSNTKITGERR